VLLSSFWQTRHISRHSGYRLQASPPDMGPLILPWGHDLGVEGALPIWYWQSFIVEFLTYLKSGRNQVETLCSSSHVLCRSKICQHNAERAEETLYIGLITDLAWNTKE